MTGASGRLEGKVILITGAARGQGRAHALRCAEEGANVVAIDICDQIATNPYPLATPADLAETAKQVEAAGRSAVAVVADVRDRDAMSAAVNQGLDRLGRLDGVVANAGICPMGEQGAEAFIDAIDVDFVGVHNSIAATLPHLNAEASIVITGSTAGLMEGTTDNPVLGPGGVGYGLAKRFLVTYSEALALQLAPRMIRVNTIHPTNTNTHLLNHDLLYKVFRPDLEAPTREDALPAFAMFHAMPIPYVEPVDIANMAVFLLADESRYVTGQQIRVDAGSLLRAGARPAQS
ncbi:MAG: mycofactocin-coupled SDR family oxidoreductase [Ilumatobacteraceae bacterium]